MDKTQELQSTKQNYPVRSAEYRALSILKQWHNIGEFINDYPAKFMTMAARMAEDCITNDLHPSMVLMTKAFGYEKTQAWVMTQLTMFNESFSTDRKMNPYQIETAASMIIDNFPNLKCSELALCLNRILSGRYGEVMYGTVEYTKITAVLNNQFYQEQQRTWEKHNEEEERKKRDEQLKDGMTWEEYCKRVGKDPADNPLLRIQKTTQESSQRLRDTKTRLIPKVGETAKDKEDFEEKRKKFLAGLKDILTLKN